MELSHRVVMVLSAQVQRQTNKTASEMLSSCVKFKSLPSLFIMFITTIRLLISKLSQRNLRIPIVERISANPRNSFQNVESLRF